MEKSAYNLKVEKSLQHMSIFIKKNIRKSKDLAKIVRKLTKLMSSSKGRDKICGIVQYLAKIIALSAKKSNIQEIQDSFMNQEMKGHLVAFRIYKSLSQARKIFRFLKFIDVVEDIIILGNRVLDEEQMRVKLSLMLFSKVSSFFYFLFDNFVWLVQSDILRDYISRQAKKQTIYIKNVFSLFRVCFSMFLSFQELDEASRACQIAARKIKQSPQSNLRQHSEQHSLLKKLMKERLNIRNRLISIMQGSIRLIILYKKLSFLHSNELNTIFCAFCGFISNIVSVIKYFNQDEVKIVKKNFSFMSMNRYNSRYDVMNSFASVFN